MIPVMRVITILRIVVTVAGADDTMTAHGIMIGAHAITTEGMDVNHAITIAAMMIGGIEL